MSVLPPSPLPSRLGFGLGGALGTPLTTLHDAAGLVRRAHEAGIRVFDTAPAYGAGEAERRLGAALEGIPRESFFVSTKAGVTSAGLARRMRDFSPGGVETSVRASLNRLGLEGVDALILHGPDPSELTASLFSCLDRLKEAGAFRLLGVAGRGVELDAALETGRFALLMAPVHAQIGDEARERLLAARAKGVAVIGIEAAGAGPAPLRLPRKPADLYTLARTLRTPASGPPRTPMPDALLAPLRTGLADCVLMSTTRPEHLDANLRAVSGQGLLSP